MRSRLLILLSLVVALLAPQVAYGHSELDTATPGPDEEVVGSPAEIVTTWTQDLDMSRTLMSVRNASGEVVAEDPVLGEDPRELRLALPDLAPGEYEVRWTSFSAEDAELFRGRYSFTVVPSPSPTVAPTTAPTKAGTEAPASAAPPTLAPTPVPSAAPASPDSDLAALVPIGIGAIVIVALAAWLLRRR